MFAGQMGPETIHFLECVLRDRPVMVPPEHARMVMECYRAADLSAEIGEPWTCPIQPLPGVARRYDGGQQAECRIIGIGAALSGSATWAAASRATSTAPVCSLRRGTSTPMR